MSKFNPGDKIRCMKDCAHYFTANKIYVVSIKKHPTWLPDQVHVEANDQGKLDSWFEDCFELVSIQKIDFKVGDVVGSNGSFNPSTRWTVEAVDQDGIFLKTVGSDSEFTMKHSETGSLFIVHRNENQNIGSCDHDWKIYHGFMHDDEFCTKCKVTRKLSA